MTKTNVFIFLVLHLLLIYCTLSWNTQTPEKNNFAFLCDIIVFAKHREEFQNTFVKIKYATISQRRACMNIIWSAELYCGKNEGKHYVDANSRIWG